jgi:hypothetical protein
VSETTSTVTTTAGPEAEHIASVQKLDERVGRIETAVTTLIAKLHGGSQQAVESRLDENSSVAEQVQAELARRDEKAKAEQHAAELGQLKESVAKLSEKPPETPPRRIEQIMGWHAR